MRARTALSIAAAVLPLILVGTFYTCAIFLREIAEWPDPGDPPGRIAEFASALGLVAMLLDQLVWPIVAFATTAFAVYRRSLRGFRLSLALFASWILASAILLMDPGGYGAWFWSRYGD